MWFKKDPYKKAKGTQLYKMLLSYPYKHKDVYGIILECIRSVDKEAIEDITIDDLRSWYKGIVEASRGSSWYVSDQVLHVRKFFRANRGNNVLKASLITEYVLKNVEINATIQPMPEKIKKKRGRPANVIMIEKVKVLREQGGLTFRQIAAAIGEDVRQAHLWYTASKTKA